MTIFGGNGLRARLGMCLCGLAWLVVPTLSVAHEEDSTASGHAASDAEVLEQRVDEPAFVVEPSALMAAGPEELQTLGEWGPVIAWPHIPVSAANLPDGRILTWASNQRNAFPSGPEFTYTATWDPATGQFVEIPYDQHDMFCGHNVVLENGQIFVNGGRNTVPNTSVFDPSTNDWSRIEDMNDPRWYPTTIFLPHGDVFTASGSGGPNTAERWSPGLGWSMLSGIDWSPIVNSPGFETNWWPYLHLNANGRLFHAGPTRDMHMIDPSGDGSMVNLGRRFDTDWYPKHGADVAYDEGKILVSGGATGHSNGASTNQAIVIDINGAVPQVTSIAPMAHARRFHNPVMLPNGEVLVIGGNTSGVKFSDQGTVLTPEIWNPVTQTWRQVADMSVPRNYHSIALLLTDGRVLSAGGGLCNCSADHMDGQVYSPPYLFAPDGSLAQRPTMTNAPQTFRHGQQISVQGSANIQTFSLIKMSSTTHAVNTDQRYLSVPFTEVLTGEYQLTIHSNPNVIPPGYYMLFAVDGGGVPSVATVVQITSAGAPVIQDPINDTLGIVATAEGANVSLPISATDPNGDPLTFSATGLPPGLSINPSTGLISGVIPQGSIGSYRVTISVSDGNGVISTTFTWQVGAPSTGQILRQWWTGISGTAITSLTGNANYPDNPSGSDFLTRFEAPTDWADNYGTRVSGYIHPPVTGDYTFWIASDDNGELWLSSSAAPSGVVRIAHVPGWSSPQQWDKFPEQQSATISLQAGQRYYIEALQKEGGGLDNLAVAWQIPGDITRVIGAQYLSPPDSAPDITDPGDQAHQEGDAVFLALSVTGQGTNYTISASGLPSGLSIDATTNQITGELPGGSAGTYGVTVTASNDAGSSNVSFSWVVAASPANWVDFVDESSTRLSLAAGFLNDDQEKDVAAGDLDKNGWDDVVVVRKASFSSPGTRVDLLLMNVNGVLIDQTDQYAPGFSSNPTDARDVLIKDLDGDGWDDVLIVTTFEDQPRLYRNLGQDGTGQWLGLSDESAARLPALNVVVQFCGVASGDIDGNGSPDLYLSNYKMDGTAEDVLLINDGSGHFSDQTAARIGQLRNSGFSTSAAIIDVDGDGDRDIVKHNTRPVVPWDSSAVVILFNNGSGNFSNWQKVPSTDPYMFAIEDLNNDGKPDVYVVEDAQDHVESATTVSIDTSVGFSRQWITTARTVGHGGNLKFADLDGDGDLDLGVADVDTTLPPCDTGQSSRKLVLFRNEAVASGTLTDPWGGISKVWNQNTYDFAYLDIDNDGDLDIFAAQCSSYAVLTNIGLVGPQPPTVVPPGDQSHIEGASISLAIEASDPLGDPLQFDAAGLPTGLSIDPDFGLITGNATAAGTYAVTVTVSNTQTDVSTTFDWTITPDNTETVIDITPVNQGVACQDNATGTGYLMYSEESVHTRFSANPPWNSSSSSRNADHVICANTINGQWHYDTNSVYVPFTPRSSDRLIAQVDFSADTATSLEGQSFVVSGIQAGYAGGDLTYSSNVWNGGFNNGEFGVSGTHFVIDTNQLPMVANPGDRTSIEGDSVVLGISASDANGDLMSFSATGLPTGLVIDAISGLITGNANTAGTFGVTVTVSDGQGSDSASFNWTVDSPNQAPQIVNPGDQTDTEGDSVSLAISASDADGDTLTFSSIGLPTGLSINAGTGVITGNVTAVGNYATTISVSDGQDSDSVSFQWTVDAPNQAPQIANPGDQTDTEGDSVSLAISASDADGDTLTFSATGLPTGLSIDTGTGVITGNVTAAGNYTPTVSVSDGQDSDSVSFQWTVDAPNQAPQIVNPGDQTDTEGDSVSLAISASDGDGDTLTFSATGLPTGLSIDTGTGVITGTVTTAGSYTPTVSVTDGQDSDSVSFQWTVDPAPPLNQAPQIVNPGDQTDTEGDSVSLAISASDADGDTLTFSATGLPTGLSIDTGTGVITGNVTAVGNYATTISVSDGQDSDSVSFQWTVDPAPPLNQAPQIANPGDQTDTEGDSVSLAISASDADGDTLTFSATGLPTGLSIDTGTGVITGNVTAAGNYTPTVSVSDGQDSDSVSFQWTVDPAPPLNQAPQIANPGDQTDTEGDSVSLAISASDADGDTLTFSATGLPTGLSIDTGTGVITGNVTAAGNYTPTVSVSDGQDSDSVSFQWTVDPAPPLNQAPQIANPGDQTDTEGDSVSLAISASDADGDTLTFSATGLPTGLSIDTGTGVITGTVTAAGSYSATVSVTDGLANDSASFQWTVDPAPPLNQPPQIVNPGDQADTEGDSVSLAISASDADGDTLTFSATGLPTGLSIDTGTGVITGTVTAAGSYTPTVSVSDGQDSDSTSFQWTVDPAPPLNQPPQIVNPGDQNHAEGDSVSLAISASDPDGDTLTFSATGLPPGLSIDTGTGLIDGNTIQAGSYNVTVTVSDGAEQASAVFGWDVHLPGNVVSEAGIMTVGQPDRDTWHTVNLTHTYVRPIVVMGPSTLGDSSPVTLRVRNVSSNSFEFKVDEWEYLDGSHGTEDIHYLVVEAGDYTLDNGQRLVADSVSPVGRSFELVRFASPFGVAPVVLSQVVSTNGPEPVITRLRNIKPHEFRVRLEEEEAGDQIHNGEDVHWIAIEPGSAAGRFEAAATPTSVTHQPYDIGFVQTYADGAVFLAAIQTSLGGNTSSLRQDNLAATGVQVFVEEEQSADAEVRHLAEVVGYLTIDSNRMLSPFDPPGQ